MFTKPAAVKALDFHLVSKKKSPPISLSPFRSESIFAILFA